MAHLLPDGHTSFGQAAGLEPDAVLTLDPKLERVLNRDNALVLRQELN